jgi:hypothetical protein
VLASGAADAAAANGSGITIDGASATFTYVSSGDKWQLNKPLDVTGNIIVSGTVDGRDVATDGTKLDGIEVGATADQTAAQILTAIKTVDGSGSGLDADTVDGLQASSFLRSDADDTMTGDLLMDSANAQINIKAGVAGTTGRINWTFNTSTTNYASLSLPYDTRATTGFHMDVGYPITIDATTQINFDIAGVNKGTLNSSGNLALTGTSHTAGGNTIWHGGNDGSGSGLDADTLDGVQGSSFLRSDATDITTGYFSVDNHFRVVNNGVSGQGDNATHFNYQDNGTNYIRGTNTYFSSPAEFANNVTLDVQSPVLQFEADANYSSYVRFSNGSTLRDGEIQYSPPVDTMYFRTGNTATRMSIDGSGNVVAAGNVTAYSDERLKDNIETLDGSKVYEMRGVSFTKDGKAGSGVIAQELQKIAPELVHEKDEYLTVAYGNVVGYLIEAVKELKTEVDDLKNQLAERG